MSFFRGQNTRTKKVSLLEIYPHFWDVLTFNMAGVEVADGADVSDLVSGLLT